MQAVLRSQVTDRDLLQQIFGPANGAPWELFSREVLADLELDHRSLLFWNQRQDLLAGVLYRSAPRDERYIGNFACNKAALEFLAIQERSEHVAAAYLLTVESINEGKIISIARSGEVSDRVLGHVESFVSSNSGQPFYWLDGDMFPARLRYSRRPFRVMKEAPEFLRIEGFRGEGY